MGPRSDDRGNVYIRQGLREQVVASMGPRSDDRGNASSADNPSATSKLQWGRDLTIAEIPWCSNTSGPRQAASMGPRSDDRGNWYGRWKRAKAIQLQWGRDLTIAEIPTGQGRASRRSGFNGAAI